MKDIKKEEINIGDEVAYAPGGSYTGISIGEVIKFTPKQVGIRKKHGGVGRYLMDDESKLYYAYSTDILVI